MQRHSIRWLAAAVVTLCVVAVTSSAFAQKRGRRAPAEAPAVENLCTAWANLSRHLAPFDLTLHLNSDQQAAFSDLKKVISENTAAMDQVCGGVITLNVTAKVDASEARLEAMLAGVRKAKPLALKFYASLNDTQRPQVDEALVWPGL